MLIITIQEFNTLPVYALENALYNRIRAALAARVGYAIADRLLKKWMRLSLRDLSLQSCFSVTDCFIII